VCVCECVCLCCIRVYVRIGMNMRADTCAYGYKLKPYNSVARHDTIMVHVASCGQPQTAEACAQYTCADRYTEQVLLSWQIDI